MNQGGPYAGLTGDGFEFGSFLPYLLWYSSLNLAFGMAVTKYCNDNGIDSAEPGMLLAWLTDCFKRGIITREDTDGLEMDWANEEVALELLRKITHREGFGNLLAEGLARAAQKLGKGTEQYAYTIKGRASVEVNLRGSHGAAIASATSTRGADHLKGWPYFEYAHLPPEWSVKYWGNAKAGDGRSPEGKAPMTVYGQCIMTLIDSLGTCKLHTSPPLDPPREDDYAWLVSSATGIDFSAGELMKAANRIYNLEHVYNVRLGLSRKDDTIPDKYLNEPCSNGPLKGFAIKREDFEGMLDDYYAYRGWNGETGIPTRETLEGLDMKEIADELEKRGVRARWIEGKKRTGS
jgi:aldehyde:ferredoxin oxidoreductase